MRATGMGRVPGAGRKCGLWIGYSAYLQFTGYVEQFSTGRIYWADSSRLSANWKYGDLGKKRAP